VPSQCIRRLLRRNTAKRRPQQEILAGLNQCFCAIWNLFRHSDIAKRQNPLTPVFHHEFVLGRALKALTQEMPSKPNCKSKAGTALPRDRIAESTRIDKMDVAVEHRDQRPG
jgi:hypothetical protein